MRWPWTPPPAAAPTNVVSVRDDVFAQFLAVGPDISGVVVDERSAMGISAFYRAVSLIAGQLAQLPFRSYTTGPDGLPRTVGSIFDDPDGPDGQTVYEWKETAVAHMLLHGCAVALRMSNAGGGLARLPLIHPGSVTITDPVKDERPVGGLWFRLRLANGETTKRLDQRDVFYVPGLSLDGRRGLSLLSYARLSLATTQAGDRAAGNMFSRGSMVAGLATPDGDEDITDDVPEIRRQLDAATSGVENAGKIALVNRRLNFQPWTMTAADAQFLQSRQFQIEEISRWTGVPPHLLMQTDKQTSWGTGVEMQDRALGRTVLASWASRFEQRESRLLANPRWTQFDFAALERPTPEIERAQIIADYDAGLITLNEARARMNLPPIAGGNTLKGAAAPTGGNDDPAAE